VDEFHYFVHSQSRDFEYSALSTEFGWICSCPDASFRETKCKHMWSIEFSLKFRERVAK